MTRILLLAAALGLAPLAAAAAPAVGDVVGTNAADATQALKALGCEVKGFEAEDGKIEAKCADAAGKLTEVYIDPATGKITAIESEED